ncbi:LAQU0S02e00210g1_1 [Lachancea quebecensis]|uniref:LAQU0S02e00210g1_1 n=1 Tax=Lachancea quebecensis TaxID=1654605 RepID=A0A0P1KME0_9SACH|nr:LAQU0S02e00210g1_1 [Lachancea quebecensis]
MSLPARDAQGLSIISCKQCRERKVRCSRNIPRCRSCDKRDYDCRYPQTHRKTSTKLTKKRRSENTRFYGCSSVNKALFEVGMPFCNIDSELESKNAPNQMRRFVSSSVYDRFIKNPEVALEAVRSIKNSIGCFLFSDAMNLARLEETLLSKNNIDYQCLLLLYSAIVFSERFKKFSPEVTSVVNELNAVLDDCPDCPEKVVSLILLADYYHYKLKIETAWKCTFLATSIAYALGLHLSSSKVWSMLVLHDALLCSVVGRPSSIKWVNPKLVSRGCNSWGEIALLLRESNDILLVSYNWTIEKVISLDFRFNDLIGRVKKDMNVSSAVNDARETLSWYLKLCILTASRVKLIYPVCPRYEALKPQLDQNCSDLSQCLRGIFGLLTSSNLATKENPYHLRSQCFLSYCSIFQGLLLELHFCSTQVTSGNAQIPQKNNNFPLPQEASSAVSYPSSLANISALLEEYDQVSDSVELCSFMLDVFTSFRVLINKKKGKRPYEEPFNTTVSPIGLTEESISNCSSFSESPVNVEQSENSLSWITGDMADWITACFSGELPTFYAPESLE